MSEVGLEPNPSGNSYIVSYASGESLPLSTTVVAAVARLLETDATSLEPLAETISPDALDTLFTDADDGQLSFLYAGCEVIIWASGDVSVVPPASSPTREANGGGAD